MNGFFSNSAQYNRIRVSERYQITKELRAKTNGSVAETSGVRCLHCLSNKNHISIGLSSRSRMAAAYNDLSEDKTPVQLLGPFETEILCTSAKTRQTDVPQFSR